VLAIGGGLVLLGYFITRIFAAGPASIYFSPASGSYNAGDTLAVQIWVNTAGQSVNAAQADFSYPAAQLQYVSADFTGSAFGIQAVQTGGNGSVSTARGNVTPVTGTVLLGTVNFTVLSSAGPAALNFLGTSAVVDSGTNQNILGSSPGASYTVVAPGGGGGTPTPTSAPTPPPTQAPTPAPAGGGGSNPAPTPAPKTSQRTTKPAAPAAPGAPVAALTPHPSDAPDAIPTPQPMFDLSAAGLVAAANNLLGTHLTVMGAAGALIPILLVVALVWWVAWRRGQSSGIAYNSHEIPPFVPTPPGPPKVTGAPPVSAGPAPKTFMPSGQGANEVVDSATSTGTDPSGTGGPPGGPAGV
jgi:hypothetical protein